jgi:hypothetical protein
MNFLRSFLDKRAQRRNQPNTHLYRLLLYVFRIATRVLMIVVVLITFAALGDFLLLTLSLLLLVALVFMLRQQLPHYIAEGQLLLGFGPVREGERIVYCGLPWRVMSINVYSILHNPTIEGVQRLPLGALRDLTSRPSKDEPWFPSGKGDYVLLPDDLFGQVVRQSADIVQLNVIGGMEVMYPSANFFALSPKNLSRGDVFVVRTKFGIDYGHQSICLGTVPSLLQAAIEQEMQSYPFGEFVRTVTFYFPSFAADLRSHLHARELGCSVPAIDGSPSRLKGCSKARTLNTLNKKVFSKVSIKRSYLPQPAAGVRGAVPEWDLPQCIWQLSALPHDTKSGGVGLK